MLCSNGKGFALKVNFISTDVYPTNDIPHSVLIHKILCIDLQIGFRDNISRVGVIDLCKQFGYVRLRLP